MNGRAAKRLRRKVFGEGPKRDKGQLLIHQQHTNIKYAEKSKRHQYQQAKRRYYRE